MSANINISNITNVIWPLSLTNPWLMSANFKLIRDMNVEHKSIFRIRNEFVLVSMFDDDVFRRIIIIIVYSFMKRHLVFGEKVHCNLTGTKRSPVLSTTIIIIVFVWKPLIFVHFHFDSFIQIIVDKIQFYVWNYSLTFAIFSM